MVEKTVLIIADSFPPEFAPRMGYLSKYLSEHGWRGFAVSPTFNHERNTVANSDFLSGYIPCKMIYTQKRKRNLFIKAVSFFIPDMRSPLELNKKMKYSVEDLIEKNRISIILCSSAYSVFPLNIANRAAKKYGIPWIADLRDIYEQYTEKDFLRRIYKKIGVKRRNYLLNSANIVVTVSKKHSEILSNYGLKTCFIYNGADTDIFSPTKKHYLEKFKIVYTGVLGSSQILKRDVSPLFSVIQKLHINKDIDSKCCRIQFFSDIESQKIINNLKISFGVSDFIDCFDFVPAAEIPKILNDASILLLLLGKGNKGIMTTKFFEYLAVKRPILCIWGDEGEVEEIINNSNAGIAAKTENDVKCFIMAKYDEWRKTRYTMETEVEQNHTKEFSRKYNAKQFIELFENALNS